jgi:hypothetical protein
MHASSRRVEMSSEEWWLYGHRVRPGDPLFQERRFHDNKITDTRFAGSTLVDAEVELPLA